MGTQVLKQVQCPTMNLTTLLTVIVFVSVIAGDANAAPANTGESTEVKEQQVRLDDVHHRHRKGNSRNRRHSEGLFTIVQVLYFDREATRKAKLALLTPMSEKSIRMMEEEIKRVNRRNRAKRLKRLAE